MPGIISIDYYEILDVPDNATPEQIRSQYKKLFRESHRKIQDLRSTEQRYKDLGDQAAITDIGQRIMLTQDVLALLKEAFETLSDAQRRGAYNRATGRRRRQEPAQQPPVVPPVGPDVIKMVPAIPAWLAITLAVLFILGIAIWLGTASAGRTPIVPGSDVNSQKATQEYDQELYAQATQAAARPTSPASTRQVSQVAVQPLSTSTPGCIGTRPVRLTVGKYARVVYDPPLSNRIRTGPHTASSIVAMAPPGTRLLVVGGPACNEKMAFWNVQLDSGVEGWTSEGDQNDYWLEPYY